MAMTSSSMLPLGSLAPDFKLPDVVTGKTVDFSELTAYQGYLIMFICRHCPYVIHVQQELASLGRDYSNRGIAMVAISSNDVTRYPEDKPEKLKAMATELKFTFPLCFDESQQVARAYQATCTPDFFLFDQAKQLIYRGQLDESRPGNGLPVTGVDLRAALESLLSGQAVSAAQRPSLGCGIKWKA